MLASGQTKDDFEFWDANNNGDLTCSEARNGPDGGLRLPAYEDDHDGPGIIYEWLERSRSSDSDNDGVACESTPNASGYVPNVQPVQPQGCPADAEKWRGLQVCEEHPREGYDRDAFGSAYSSVEDDIIDMLPPTMKAGGQVYTPYSCLAFEIRADGTAATDIEHIVALAEAHDSGIADDRRRDIASDLDNLTIADPAVNRSQKSDRDAGEWAPARHRAWFAAQVIAVKLRARATGVLVMLAAKSEGAATIRVTATDAGGLSAAQSFSVTVEMSASRPFTDHPIRSGVTLVRAVHFMELRARIDALRQMAGLQAFPWTDPVLRTGATRIRLAHLLELRRALADAYATAGRAAGRRRRRQRLTEPGLDRPHRARTGPTPRRPRGQPRSERPT